MARRKKHLREAADSGRESRAVDAATVAWMLSVMTTLACAAVAAIVWLFAHDHADRDGAVLFARLLHFSSCVTAVVSLVLLVAVLATRREPPPASIVAFAVIVALLPLVAILL